MRCLLPYLRPILLFLTVAFIMTPPMTGANEMNGLASWYGGKFQGRKTANGEIFDTNKLTAAHRSLDFGTIVRVHNLENGKSVDVRINDRGPFVTGRVIDLSRAAAEELSMVATGVAPVKLEVVSLPPGGVPQDLYKRHEKEEPGLIQIASFSSRENADASRRKLAANGITSTIEHASSGHFRVIVPLASPNGLEEMKARLARLGYQNVLVRRGASSGS